MKSDFDDSIQDEDTSCEEKKGEWINLELCVKHSYLGLHAALDLTPILAFLIFGYLFGLLLFVLIGKITFLLRSFLPLISLRKIERQAQSILFFQGMKREEESVSQEEYILRERPKEES